MMEVCVCCWVLLFCEKSRKEEFEVIVPVVMAWLRA
jgi:hypothetical protein